MVSLKFGVDRFAGRLTIQPGAITFDPAPRANSWVTANTIEPIIHTDPTVVAVRARLLLPNLSWSLELRGQTQRSGLRIGRVDMGMWDRRPVTGALIAAGFVVDETVTWFSLRPPAR